MLAYTSRLNGNSKSSTNTSNSTSSRNVTPSIVVKPTSEDKRIKPIGSNPYESGSWLATLWEWAVKNNADANFLDFNPDYLYCKHNCICERYANTAVSSHNPECSVCSSKSLQRQILDEEKLD